MLVVAASSVMQTMIQQAPLVFLREAEVRYGQVDVWIQPEQGAGFQFLNHSAIARQLAEAGAATQYDFSHNAARMRVAADAWSSTKCDQSVPSADAAAADVAPLLPSWPYLHPDSTASAAQLCSLTCLPERCNATARQPVNLYLLDTAKEQRMGVGRQWDLAPLAPGEAAMHARTAASLGLEAGDAFLLRAALPLTLRHAFAPSPEAASDLSPSLWAHASTRHSHAVLQVRLVETFDSSEGKFAGDDGAAVVLELPVAGDHIAESLHPAIRSATNEADLDRAVRKAATGSTPREGLQPLPRAHSPGSYLSDWSDMVLLNLPARRRVDAYGTSDFGHTLREVSGFAAAASHAIGFPSIGLQQPLLQQLRTDRFLTLFLGLVLNILVFILFALSSILIYSLMTINVQARTFELAVRRMVGATKSAVVGLLSMQAAAYAIPGWLFGLAVGSTVCRVILGRFQALSGIPVPLGLSGSSVLTGTILALLVPFLGSIGPVSSALRASLRESLETGRPRTSAVKVTVERSEDARVSFAVVALGLVLVAFGFAIYYLIPLSLLSMDLSLFFNIFFSVLIGMLLGFVLLSLNLEMVIEHACAALLLSWWEHPAVLSLTLTNMVAHRERNRRTSIMYALSVAFVVFASINASQSVESAELWERASAGTPLWVDYWTRWTGRERLPNPAPLMSIAERHWGREHISPLDYRLVETIAREAPGVQATGWEFLVGGRDPIRHSLPKTIRRTLVGQQAAMTSPTLPGEWSEVPDAAEEEALQELLSRGTFSGQAAGLSRVAAVGIKVQAISPNLFSVLLPEFVKPAEWEPKTGLSLSELLYTTRGGQSAVVSYALQYPTGIEQGNDWLYESDSPAAAAASPRSSQEGNDSFSGLLEGALTGAAGGGRARTRLNAAVSMNNAPAFSFSRTPEDSGGSALVSLPALSGLLAARGAPSAVEELRPLRMYISLGPETMAPEGDVKAADAAVSDRIQASGRTHWSSSTVLGEIADMTTTARILNLVFASLTAVAMFLSFFALFSAMVTNMQDQRREVGVLLAVGLRGSRMTRVYILEGFLLVLSSSVLGILVGTAVSWAFSQQRGMFTQLPLRFPFPYSILATVLCASAVLAVAGVWCPARRLLRRPITHLIKGLE